MSGRIAGSLLLLCLCGCGDSFEDACDVLKKIPHGTEVRVLERRLSLPAPTKTFAGSSLYEHRIFEYHRKDGLFVVIGLIQESVEEYPKGRFVARGHYMVFQDSRKWVQWEWEDWKPSAEE
jgi:hypothetical protein